MISNLYCGDCLEEMNKIEDGSIDAIITDLPYGTIICKWDSVIPFKPMWEQLKRIIKKNGTIVLFGSQPFTSALIMSNIKMFKYEWIWDKDRPTGFALANKMPMKVHENILIFNDGSGVYHPQMTEGTPYIWDSERSKGEASGLTSGKNDVIINEGTRYPRSVQKFNQDRGLHPTQKPVKLFEWLIKTYSNEKDIVLDSCAGSGTTGVAASQTNRYYILIEKEEEYYNLTTNRLKNIYSITDFI